MTPLPRMRPLVRYHGGKARIADWIVGHMPPHEAYTEVYGGGASVLLRKPRVKAEVYNDLDETMVHLFRVLRGPRAAELVRALELTPYSRDEFVTAYEPCDDDIERARRTIVRSFMSYGSDGTTGHYTTGFRLQVSSTNKLPAGEWSTYPRALRRIIDRIRPADESRGVVIENCDAMLLLPRMDSPHTLHYVDPPYLPETRSQGNRRRGAGYHVYAHELDTDQHHLLLQLLCGLDGMVMLSGYPSPLYDAALGGWRRVEKATYADRGGKRTECLWLNPAAQRAIEHGPLFA